MKITMGGEYALRCKPDEPVRILCTDRNTDLPVVFLTHKGAVYEAKSDGTNPIGPSRAHFDLVPLKKRATIFMARSLISGNYLPPFLSRDSVSQDWSVRGYNPTQWEIVEFREV